MRQLFCDSEFHAYAIIRRILKFASSFFIRVLKVERFPLLMESKLKTLKKIIEFQGRKKNSITELILADTLASHLRGSFFNFALVLQENALVFSQSETRSYFFHIHF